MRIKRNLSHKFGATVFGDKNPTGYNNVDQYPRDELIEAWNDVFNVCNTVGNQLVPFLWKLLQPTVLPLNLSRRTLLMAGNAGRSKLIIPLPPSRLQEVLQSCNRGTHKLLIWETVVAVNVLV